MTSSPAAQHADVYDPEDVGLRNSPPLKQMTVNLGLSPSPEPLIPLPQATPESSPDPENRKSKGKGRTRKFSRPSPGDAVLIAFLADGKQPDIAREAGERPLAMGNGNEGEEQMRGVIIDTNGKNEKDMEIQVEEIENLMDEKDALAALAAGAVGILRETERASSDPAQRSPTPRKEEATATEKLEVNAPGEPMEDIIPSIPIPPISKTLHVRTVSLSQNMVKHEIVASPTEALPPMRQQSPKSAQSNGSSHITLPSISESIGDITRLPAQPESPFTQSPPGMQPPRFNTLPSNGHGSPPKSPNYAFHRELPSPGGRSSFSYHRRPSQVDGPQFSSPIDHTGSSTDTQTPSTDQSESTPATIAIDRMSIDGITNPQIGGYQCTYQGCTAAPFQTQYLLNSHANVHSSNRPHYCSVAGCPRAEGGKGFKRKNEMIRHGLVHDSPGYVCPFCPDREHKYPRPDNLQRHVRVHHMDKDKDDLQLKEVLAQRAEGPARGRRRRGGTT